MVIGLLDPVAHEGLITPEQGMEAAVNPQEQQGQLAFFGGGIQAGAVDAGAVLAHHGSQLVTAEPESLGGAATGLGDQLGIGLGERLQGERSEGRGHGAVGLL